MRCVDPFVKGGEAYSCGRCLPCKKRSAFVWSNRIQLEASQHVYSSCATLTYDEVHVPKTLSLVPDDLTRWLKRFRQAFARRFAGARVRYYACGEYGSKGRPHYHVVLFGSPGCYRGRNRYQWCGDCSCVICSAVANTWNMGATSLEPLSKLSSAYVAGYVTRKISALVPTGVYPPFTRMSRRPGIGADATWELASSQIWLNVNGRRLNLSPLGRYLTQLVVLRSGSKMEGYRDTEAMQALRDFAWQNSVSIASVLRAVNEPFASQLEQKERCSQRLL